MHGLKAALVYSSAQGRFAAYYSSEFTLMVYFTIKCSLVHLAFSSDGPVWDNGQQLNKRKLFLNTLFDSERKILKTKHAQTSISSCVTS